MVIEREREIVIGKKRTEVDCGRRKKEKQSENKEW